MANLQLIKDILERKNITINDFAESVGLTSQSIHLMVRTNSTKIDTLEKIASALGVPISVFFDGEFPKSTPTAKSSLPDNPAHTVDRIAYLERENSDLRAMLKDKDTIISLLTSHMPN